MRNKQIRKNPENKNKSKKRVKSKKNLIFASVFIVVTGAAAVYFNIHLFKVKNFNVAENNRYMREDIVAASGIEEGAELFGFDVRLAENNIKRKLAYIYTADIIRLPPSTVRISIKTDEPMFGLALGKDYYIITDTFRVAEKTETDNKNINEHGTAGIIDIVADCVTKCFVGEKIEFSDEDITDFLSELINLARDEKMAEMISSVDIRDKFNVVMNYSDLYLVRLGVFENVYSKALSSFDVIEQLSELTGIIDISDDKIASFIPDENITNNRLYFNK